MDKMPLERRKHPRIPVHFSVFYRIDRPVEVRVRIREEEVNAIMLDLSEGGVSVSTNYNIPAGALLLVKFTLINEYAKGDERTRSMFIDGEVCDSQRLTDKECRLGIQFNYLSKQDQEAIRSLVEMINKPPA